MPTPPEASPAGADGPADALARLRATTVSVRAEHARWRADATSRGAAREAAARRGELGPGVRELQGRVDAGLTTWAAVLDGRDRTVAAREARGHVEAGLAGLASRTSLASLADAAGGPERRV